RDRDNPASRALNGAEADVLAALPATAPVPALVDVFAEGEWFVLVTQAAPGALPKAPWTPAQLGQVLRALDELQEATTPCPVRALRSVPDTLGPEHRPRRDRDPGPAAGLLDHAGQGQPRDPRGRADGVREGGGQRRRDRMGRCTG